MSPNTTNDKNIPKDAELYYETLASEEEIYLEETEEELRAILSSEHSAPSESNSLSIDSVAGVVDEKLEHAAEELYHRQGCERVLPKSINRQLNEPSMEARARPRGTDSHDEPAGNAESSQPA